MVAWSMTQACVSLTYWSRYLVIIDGVENTKVWDAIRAAFFPDPDNNKQGSRLVVTTSSRSIATKCSTGGSYLYTMRGLDNDDSANLFWAKLGPENRVPVLDEGLGTFFRKCDGLPLVLVDTAQYLQGKERDLSDEDCEDVGNGLGRLLAGEEAAAFGETRAALARCCDSVRKPGHKMCALSVCSFPQGHPISRKALIRRWIAEDLVSGDSQLSKNRVATRYLYDLLDQGIVEPAPYCGSNGDTIVSSSTSNKQVKRCKVHGVMLEFLVRQSASWNFTTLIEGNRVVRNHETPWPARRLAVHGAASDRDVQTAGASIRLSHVRSLTARNSNNLLSCLRSCRQLRLLDLESCSWLGNDHLLVVCGLLHLRYLSLRSTSVSQLPEAIQYLQCLETLDVRKTGVDKLPMEVIMLPLLAHLFGEFELPAELGDANREKELKEFFSHKSKLHTLAGFKIVYNHGFELILRHASNLKKVKIWCESLLPPLPPLPPRRGWWSAVRKSFTKSFGKKKINNSDSDFTGSLVSLLEERALDSLSVNFGGLCQDQETQNFLVSVLKDPCAVSSIKVSGQMATLPASSTLTKLRHIKEMHLCNTGLLSEDLSGLQNLDCLVYLKLAENRLSFWEGSFLVKTNGFLSLKQLCFHGTKIPDLYFEKDAKCPLTSLQLICLEPAKKLGVTGITHLQSLNQIILHPNAPPEKIEAWKQETIKHENRPYVQKKPASSE